MKYTLPKLGFETATLEPWMDAKTVEVHYGKHHQTYCDKFNEAVEKHSELAEKSAEEIIANLNAVPEDIRTAVRNFGGGFVNHNFFWSILAPMGQQCSGKILEGINKEFGSFDKFKEAFSAQALKVFGSGWTWLVLNPKSKKLEIVNTSNQDSPLSQGMIPILTIDLWEHAYYLKYMNKRADFVAGFWNIINWKKVEEIYASVSEKSAKGKKAK